MEVLHPLIVAAAAPGPPLFLQTPGVSFPWGPVDVDFSEEAVPW